MTADQVDAAPTASSATGTGDVVAQPATLTVVHRTQHGAFLSDHTWRCLDCLGGPMHRCGRDHATWANPLQVCECPEPGCWGDPATREWVARG